MEAPVVGGGATVERMVSTDESECTACADGNGGVCSPPELLRVIEEVVGSGGARSPAAAKTGKGSESEDILPQGKSREAEVVREAAKQTGCFSESCVVGALEALIVKKLPGGRKDLKDLLRRNFKAAGPRDSTRLTSNFDLDGTLDRWAVEFPGFFPLPFAMMDFWETGEPLARWSVSGILQGKRSGGSAKDCVACILNTDLSTGPGKHWVCVFVGARDTKPEAEKRKLMAEGKPTGCPISVEYFNSAGNPPPRAVGRWMEETRDDLIRAEGAAGTNRPVITKAVTSVKHQRSDTECGLYALFYIRARLEGRPVSDFEGRRISDDEMTDFRKHVFRRHGVVPDPR